MNSENEIITKISANVTPLKQGIAEAKQSIAEFQGVASNFKVNWDGGSGSIEEYNKYLKQANAEWEEYKKQQEELAQASEQAATSISESATSISESSSASEQASSSGGRLAQIIDEVRTAFGNAKDSVEGYTMRLNESTKSNSLLHTTARTARTGILALSAAVTAYAKSSIDEYAKSNTNFAATQERVSNSINELKRAFGAVLASLYPLIDGFTQWLVQNKELATVLVSAAAGIVAAGAAVKAFSVAVSVAKALTSGWVGVLSLVAGVAAAAYVSTIDLSGGLSDNSAKIAELQTELADIDSQLANTSSAATGAGSNATKQIEKVRQELADLEFDFRQSLKKIAVDHEKTLQDLTSQIEQENIEYQKAIDERNASFAASQAEEEKEHQDKVDELTKQINFLQRYNNKYNKEKLAQLQYALEKENKLYQARTEAEQAELDAQIAAEQASHEAKLASLQAELNDELAFQEKHREALQSVRDVILLDEIESLQRQHEAQIVSYNEQLTDALSYGSAAGNNYSQAQIDALKKRKAEIEAELQSEWDRSTQAYNNGYNSAVSWTEGVRNHLSEGGIVADIWKIILGEGTYNKLKNGALFKKPISSGGGNGWATGGYTGYGAPDEIAGLVHKGEYVLRADQVDQSTGLPKNMGQVNNIYINGTFATSASERRKVAQQIANALGQVQKARLIN